MTTPNIAPNYVLAAGVGVLANRTIENFTSNLAMLGAVNVAQKNGSELELASIMNVVMSYSQHYNTFSTPC